MRRICVYCGGNFGSLPVYQQAAAEVGKQIAERGIELVYGGGRVGLMGTVADAALTAGGRVIGVIPELLRERELAHLGLSELHIMPDMHQRKALMERLADAFIVLPGGFGTFDELLEIATWAQLGIHHKPVAVLNVNNYYQGLIQLFDHAENEGLLMPRFRSMVHFTENLAELFSYFEAHYGTASASLAH